MISFLDARDELFVSVKLAYEAQGALLTPTPVIVWPGEAVPNPDTLLTFARPFFERVTRVQKTLRRIGNLSVFESTCLFTLQIFAPQSQADGADNAIKLGEAVQNVVSKSSTSGALWYRDAKATPVPGPVGLNQVNVTSTVVFQSEE